MILKEYKSVLQMVAIACIAYGIEKLLFLGLAIDTSKFTLSLEKTYLMMLFFSVLIMVILNVVFQKNKDVVGMTFLLITTIKVVVISIIGKAFILPNANPVEKWNYFGLFALFLFFETFLTGRRLNRTKF